jgi:hypothetical protein
MPHWINPANGICRRGAHEAEEQLGLKLKTTRAGVQTLVIDHVEEPSPNKPSRTRSRVVGDGEVSRSSDSEPVVANRLLLIGEQDARFVTKG